MSALSRLLAAIGLLSLFHAAYSAHEHTILMRALPSTSAADTAARIASVPLDIKLETLFAVFLVCFGLVLAQDPLRPISWSSWAGKIEKETGGRTNPFRALEDRVGFMDIRTKRKEFTDWVRQGGNEQIKN